MNDLRTAAQQALEALEYATPTTDWSYMITALRAALAQQDEPAQEPVAYIHRQGNHWEVSERHLDSDEKSRGWTEEPLYTAPPQRRPLTEEVAALTAQRDALLGALRALVRNEGLDPYSYLDKGIGTATAAGQRWLNARAAIKKVQGG